MGKSILLKFLKVKALEETMYLIIVFIYFFDSSVLIHKSMEMKYFSM